MTSNPPTEAEVLENISRLEYMAADYRTAPAVLGQLDFWRHLLDTLRSGRADGGTGLPPLHRPMAV